MESFVVLVKGIGQHWTEGDVVTRQEFDTHVIGHDKNGAEIKGVDINRLLSVKAIRYATEQEKGQKKVVFKDSMRPSHHHEMAQQIETITHLRQRVAELENQLAAKSITVQSTTPNKPVADLLRMKEEKIEKLQMQMADMIEEIKSLKSESAGV